MVIETWEKLITPTGMNLANTSVNKDTVGCSISKLYTDNYEHHTFV